MCCEEEGYWGGMRVEKRVVVWEGKEGEGRLVREGGGRETGSEEEV
jgi:hypothetical protein